MSERIKGFDGLRALAAMAVVFEHTAAGFAQMGGVAVNLFFALSGFLIVGNLHSMRLAVDNGRARAGAQLKRFWVRRALRIMPAYYAVILVCLVVLAALGMLNGIEAIFLLTYTQNFFYAYIGDWTSMSHTWTLAVEQQFYILMAPVLLFVPAMRHSRLLAQLVLSAAALSLLCLYVLPSYVSWLHPFAFARFPVIGLLLGCAGGYLAIRPDLRIPGLPVAVGAAVLVMISPLPSGFLAARPAIDYVNFLFQMAICPLIVAAVACHQQSRIVGWLDTRALVFLGKISYSLYLVHYLVAELLKDFWPVDLAAMPMREQLVQKLLIFAVTSVISIALATLSYRFVELPFLRKKPREVIGKDMAAAH